MRELDGGVGSRKHEATMLKHSVVFFKNLVELAAHQTKEKRLNWSWPKEVDYKRFIVPLQNVLSNSAPLAAAVNRNSMEAALPSAAYQGTSAVMWIDRFSNDVAVAMSKAKPKTIRLTTTCGKSIKFLLQARKEWRLAEGQSTYGVQ